MSSIHLYTRNSLRVLFFSRDRGCPERTIKLSEGKHACGVLRLLLRGGKRVHGGWVRQIRRKASGCDAVISIYCMHDNVSLDLQE